MDNLVERLRGTATPLGMAEKSIFDAAAGEIERLRGALRRIADGQVFPQMLAKAVLLPERQRPE